MGVRAPPAVASQVSPSQALTVLDTANVPETELLGNDDMSVRSNSVISDDSFDDEITQFPNVSQSLELQQNATADTVGFGHIKRTQKCSVPDPILGPDYPKTPHRWEIPDPIQMMKLETVAIANALQLEAARRHASPFPL